MDKQRVTDRGIDFFTRLVESGIQPHAAPVTARAFTDAGNLLNVV